MAPFEAYRADSVEASEDVETVMGQTKLHEESRKTRKPTHRVTGVVAPVLLQ